MNLYGIRGLITLIHDPTPLTFPEMVGYIMTVLLLILRLIVIILLIYVVYNIFFPANTRKSDKGKYGSGNDNIVDAEFEELDE